MYVSVGSIQIFGIQSHICKQTYIHMRLAMCSLTSVAARACSGLPQPLAAELMYQMRQHVNNNVLMKPLK